MGAIYEHETRRFSTPLKRYEFPLAAGKSWNQWVEDLNAATRSGGPINYYVRVSGWEKVTTPAGTFDAIDMFVIARLDDEEFWRYPTVCNYSVLYAPAVRGVVKQHKDASYLERGDAPNPGARIRTQSTSVELTSFTPGKS